MAAQGGAKIMATYLELKTHLENSAVEVGLTLLTSDGFEVLKQSQNFEHDEIIILNDVADLRTNNTYNKGGHISNNFQFDFWFVKPFVKDDNQDDLDTTYSELKAAANSYFFQLNKASTIQYIIENWADARGKITDNYILAINTKFTLKTQCNLT